MANVTRASSSSDALCPVTLADAIGAADVGIEERHDTVGFRNPPMDELTYPVDTEASISQLTWNIPTGNLALQLVISCPR
eukprot:12275779-Prorocentrum_lima.AAC.1